MNNKKKRALIHSHLFGAGGWSKANFFFFTFLATNFGGGLTSKSTVPFPPSSIPHSFTIAVLIWLSFFCMNIPSVEQDRRSSLSDSNYPVKRKNFMNCFIAENFSLCSRGTRVILDVFGCLHFIKQLFKPDEKIGGRRNMGNHFGLLMCEAIELHWLLV